MLMPKRKSGPTAIAMYRARRFTQLPVNYGHSNTARGGDEVETGPQAGAKLRLLIITYGED